MSGVGGDEAFCGYKKYKSGYLNYYIQKYLNFHSTFNSSQRFLKVINTPFPQYIPWRHFNDKDKNKFFDNEFIHGEQGEIIEKLLTSSNMEKPLQKIMYVFNKTWLVGDLLQGADKMSMAASIEQRVPFVDPAILEYGMNLRPISLLWSEKALLKNSFKDMIPDTITKRVKLGFQVPEIAWTQKYLKSQIVDVLTSAKFVNRDVFNKYEMNKLVEDYKLGNQVDLKKIWMLFMLEIWFNIFVDQSNWREY